MAKHTSAWIQEALAAGLKMPKEIQAFIKKNHGKVVARTYISTRRKVLQKQMRKTLAPTAMPQAKEPTRSYKAAVAMVQPKHINGDLMGALKAVHEAAEKVGGLARLIELVEVLGQMK
jgi:hypothetical protein